MLDGREIKRNSYLGQTKAKKLRNIIGFAVAVWTVILYGGPMLYTRLRVENVDDIKQYNGRLVPDRWKEAYAKDQEERLAQLIAIKERHAQRSDHRKYNKE